MALVRVVRVETCPFIFSVIHTFNAYYVEILFGALKGGGKNREKCLPR